MKSQNLKTLFIVMAAAVAVTGVNYVAGHNTQTVYASEINDQNEEGKVDIKVTYNNDNSSNSIDPVITIKNTYDKELNLKDLNLQYYYPYNGESDEEFACYYAGTVDGEYKNLSDNVEGTIKKSDDGRYADIAFNGGSIGKGQSISIQANIHKKDWTNYDTIDKSECRTNAYIGGKLVFGDDKKEENVQDAKLSKNIIDYTPEADKDVDIKIQLNGNKLLGITDISFQDKYGPNESSFDLKEGEDYTVKYDDSGKDCIVTLKRKYLISGDLNDYEVLQFNFSKGKSQNLTINNVLPMLPNGYMMGVGSKEVNYNDSAEVPLYVNSLNYYKSLYSCEAEIKYDPNQVRVLYVRPAELVDKSENLKYEDDREHGILKITYQADKVIDSSYLGIEASICNITFQGINGEMGSESDLVVSGTARDVDMPGGLDINNINTGKIVFKGKENVDLSMPVLETNCMSIMDDEKDIDIKINENGNKFLGIEGLEEGKDYSFKNNILKIKTDSLKKCRYYDHSYDLNLNFENNIRKVITVEYICSVVPEYFTVDIEGAQGNCGGIVKIPVSISHNVGDILTQCDFNLKYDPDMFEDAYIECDNETGKLNWETDKETGTVHVTYDKCDDTLNGGASYDEAEGTQLAMNLVLKVKNNGLIGDTRIGFESNEFKARNTIFYDAHFCGSRLVTIEK